MHTSGSILRTIIEQVRVLLDLPTVDAKYSDNYMVSNLIGSSVVHILARLHMTNQAPYIFRLPITIVEGQTSYELPPNIQEVLRVAGVDDQGAIVYDPRPGHTREWGGEVWRLTGAPGAYSVEMGPELMKQETATVYYVANGDMVPHLGTGSIAASGTKHVLTLATSPTLGLVDRRPNAMQGMILRILPSGTATQIESRVIESQVVSSGAWKVTVPAFSGQTPPVASIEYEVVPMGFYALVDAVAADIAYKLGNKATRGQLDNLMLQYKKAMKTIGDMMTNVQMREGTSWHRNTVDRLENAGIFNKGL